MADLLGVRGFLCLAIAVASALGGRASSAESFRLLALSGPFLPYENLGYPGAPGFSIEVVTQVFAGMGAKADIAGFPLYRGWEMFLSGESDGMVRAPRSEQLERVCSFPDEPLKQDKYLLFVRVADAERLKISSFDDLAGHNVAVQIPPSFHPDYWPELWNFLREHHNLIETNGTNASFPMLAAGHVDYAVTTLDMGIGAISRLGLSGKIEPLSSSPVMDVGWYVCFSKTRVSSAFVEAFSRALKQFKQTDTFQEISHKYFP